MGRYYLLTCYAITICLPLPGSADRSHVITITPCAYVVTIDHLPTCYPFFWVSPTPCVWVPIKKEICLTTTWFLKLVRSVWLLALASAVATRGSQCLRVAIDTQCAW